MIKFINGFTVPISIMTTLALFYNPNTYRRGFYMQGRKGNFLYQGPGPKNEQMIERIQQEMPDNGQIKLATEIPTNILMEFANSGWRPLNQRETRQVFAALRGK